MKFRCKHMLIALLSANFVAAVVGFLAVRQIADVAAVQASLERNWEINFDEGGRPSLLPASVDTALGKVVDNLVGPQRGPFSGPKTNRDVVWRERIWALLRGRITQIEIWYPERMREDLGAALARFPSLERLVIHDAGFTREDWTHLFAGFNDLPHLKELEIGGDTLDDRTLEGLRGSRVRRLVINEGGLAEFSPATFAQMPDLKDLTIAIHAIGTTEVDPPLPEIQKLIREALPGVKVSFE